MLRSALVASLALALLAVDTSDALAQGVAERREQLARIAEQLNDPDPLMRLAFMEEIATSGRALDLQIAVKTALASEDPELRNLATRAYFSNVTELSFELHPPPDAVAKLEAVRGDRQKEAAIKRPYGYLFAYLTSLGSRLLYEVDNASFESGRFEVFSTNHRPGRDDKTKGSGAIVGTKVTIRSPVYIQSQPKACEVEVRPGNDMVLRGQATCRGIGPVAVSAPMY